MQVNRDIARWINRGIDKRSGNLFVSWTGSHLGEPGNETADSCAKAGASLQLDPALELALIPSDTYYIANAKGDPIDIINESITTAQRLAQANQLKEKNSFFGMDIDFRSSTAPFIRSPMTPGLLSFALRARCGLLPTQHMKFRFSQSTAGRHAESAVVELPCPRCSAPSETTQHALYCPATLLDFQALQAQLEQELKVILLNNTQLFLVPEDQLQPPLISNNMVSLWASRLGAIHTSTKHTLTRAGFLQKQVAKTLDLLVLEPLRLSHILWVQRCADFPDYSESEIREPGRSNVGIRYGRRPNASIHPPPAPS